MENPLHQFMVRELFPVSLGGRTLPFTNSALFMVIAAVAATGFLLIAMRRGALVPGRLQSMAEMSYETVAEMIGSSAGPAGMKYLPFIFTLFLFVLFGNLIGLIPYSFTFTSHIIITFGMAIVIFVGVTIIGFARHGLHYFSLFFPEGAPWWTAPILIPIELISYLSRPFSLSIRLFANMTAGHVLLQVLAGFVVALGVFGFVPLAFLVAITALEFLIALLQAYIFAILSCIYLNDALNLH